MRRNIVLIVVALTVLCSETGLLAQKAVNRSVQVCKMKDGYLPAVLTDLYFFDGKLRLASCDMVISAPYNNGYTGDAVIDTVLLAVDQQLNYIIRRPMSEEVYFTKCDSKGNSYLYERYEKKPGKYDVRRVRPARFSYTIEHPVFSPDGRAMVFSSDCPLGFGGRDLWYSEWSNGAWQYPQNMGHRINSENDEISPSMYGEYLLFASNGRGGNGGFDLFSTRLIASQQTGDTVSMFPIGLSQVYSLEQPFCSEYDDIAIVVNDDLDGGWWVVRDTSRKEFVYQFKGGLQSVKLSGTITDAYGRPIPNVSVTVHGETTPDVTIPCNKNGKYALFLQPGAEYELHFAAKEHFSVTMPIIAEHNDAERLYNIDYQNIELMSFAVDSVYNFGDLFHSSAGSELSAQGRARMDLLARFLMENPHLKLTIVSTYNQSDDIAFCRLLNQSRLRSLTDYLTGKGVPIRSLETSTRVPNKKTVYVAGRSTGDSVNSQSSETVHFIFSR